MTEEIKHCKAHDATEAVCKCGHRWDYVRTYSNGDKTYTSALVRNRFMALYGSSQIPFVRIEHEAGQ